jgi:hypothetical protein
MKLLVPITAVLLCSTMLSGAIPTQRSMTIFLDDLNIPFAVTANGCNFNSSLSLGGVPHFNINAGVTSAGAVIVDPTTEGETKPTLSIFHIKGTIGLLEGFGPTPSWQGLFGLELGAKAFVSPLFGDIGKDKDSFPYGLGGLAKISMLKGTEIIPDLSFSLEYTYLLNGAFKYHDYEAQETATCEFTLSSLYYHLDMMTKLNLVGLHAGIGWISPKLKADFTIADAEGIFESESVSLLKYYGGLSVPVDLVDVSFEIGQADQNTFFGIGVGLRM